MVGLVPTSEAARAFEQLSPVYDATREPPDDDLLERVTSELRQRAVRTILEVGVGTGRMAGPLTARGFTVTGVDPSLGMMSRARAKGVRQLVRGSAYHLPFSDGAFDATLFVHVLHVLDRAEAALAEATRVAGVGAFALVNPNRRRRAPGADPDPRRLVNEELRAQGVVLPERRGRGPREREPELLAKLPPDQLVVVVEKDVTEPAVRRLDMIERRASRHYLDVPAEPLARAVATVRSRIGDATHTYHQVEALALWTRPPVGDAGAPSAEPTNVV